MRLQRHFVAYCDSGFLSCAVLSLSSFLQTQRFDRLTLLHPQEPEDADSGRLLADVIRWLRRTDRRVRAVAVQDLAFFPERHNEALRRSHPQLFADVLRAYVFAAMREPVAVFDLDMLMVADASELFALRGEADLAAAPDMVSLLGERAGLELYQNFAAFVGSRPGAARLRDPRPVNCGLLVISSDLSQRFQEGLGLAMAFLKAYHAGETGEPKPVIASLLRHTLGQLAWNYVFQSCQSVRLPRSFNWYPDRRAAVSREGRVQPAGTRIFHYIGQVKARMTMDYTVLFGKPSHAVSRPQGA